MKTSWKIWAIIGVVAIISMATVGVAYASNGSITPNCSNSNSLCVFSWVKCNDNGATVAHATATINSTKDTINFILKNDYPGYIPTISFGLLNQSYMPGVISSITINCPQYFTMTLNGITKGQVIDPNKEITGALNIGFLNSAPNSTMGKTYSMSVTILVTQSSQPCQNKTVTCLTSTPNPSTFSQPVMFTAKITGQGGIPTGTVTFYDGKNSIGSGKLSGGSASISVSTLIVGSHNITAVYSGDGNFVGSTSNLVVQKVRSKTTTYWPSKPNPCNYGKTCTFTAQIEIQSHGIGVPTGTVTFCDGNETLGTVSLSTGGQAKFSISSLSRGTHTITAVYGGDDNCNTSSNTFSQVIN